MRGVHFVTGQIFMDHKEVKDFVGSGNLVEVEVANPLKPLPWAGGGAGTTGGVGTTSSTSTGVVGGSGPAVGGGGSGGGASSTLNKNSNTISEVTTDALPQGLHDVPKPGMDPLRKRVRGGSPKNKASEQDHPPKIGIASATVEACDSLLALCIGENADIINLSELPSLQAMQKHAQQSAVEEVSPPLSRLSSAKSASGVLEGGAPSTAGAVAPTTAGTTLRTHTKSAGAAWIWANQDLASETQKLAAEAQKKLLSEAVPPSAITANSSTGTVANKSPDGGAGAPETSPRNVALPNPTFSHTNSVVFPNVRARLIAGELIDAGAKTAVAASLKYATTDSGDNIHGPSAVIQYSRTVPLGPSTTKILNPNKLIQQQQQQAKVLEQRAAQKTAVENNRTIRVRHLLIKHKEVRNPTISGLGGKRVPVSRSPNQADVLIRQLSQKILMSNGADFAKIVRENSECSSARKGGDESGDLGWFSQGKMQKTFEDVSFALKNNEISDIFSTDSGFHIVQRRG